MCVHNGCVTGYSVYRTGFNPRGGAGGQMPPQGFQLPPKHMTPSIIRLLPCQMCPSKFLQLLILPPQGRMSRLNAEEVVMYLCEWWVYTIMRLVVCNLPMLH